MPKNKKGKQKAHFEENQPPLAPAPPQEYAPEYEDDAFGLGGILEDIEEDRDGGNDGGTGWVGDGGGGEGEGEGGGGWGENDGWNTANAADWTGENVNADDTGWGNRGEYETGDDREWGQPQPQMDRHTHTQTRDAIKGATKRNGASGGDTEAAAWGLNDGRGGGGWGAAAGQPVPRGQPQTQTRLQPHAQPQTGWGGWAAEAMKMSQAGLVPPNTGHWNADHTRAPQGGQANTGMGNWGEAPRVSPNGYAGGTRNELSPQQRTHMLHSILGRTDQNRQQGPPVPPKAPQQQGQKRDRGGKKGKKNQQQEQQQHQQQAQPQQLYQQLQQLQQHQPSQPQLRKRRGRDFGGWDDIPEEEEWEQIREEEVPHSPNPRGQFASMLSSVLGPHKLGFSYPMQSKTMALAAQGVPQVQYGNHNRAWEHPYSAVHFIESQGVALADAERALYSTSRKARDRIHWMFSPHKDERVVSLLSWIQSMSQGLATFGLQKFLETRERGALFANADFRPSNSPAEPAFDWMIFDDLQFTRDRTLQESVAYYDPAKQVIVFVFLLSRTGNSMAIWRRKLDVPNNTRLKYTQEILLAKAALRKNYEIHVDELPISPPPAASEPKKKRRLLTKRKWFGSSCVVM